MERRQSVSRSLYLLPQAGLWTNALHLEGAGPLQFIRMVICCGIQSGAAGAIKTGLIAAEVCGA